MNTIPLVAIAALLPLTACTTGERGLVSAHQPIVSATGATVTGCPDWSDSNSPASESQSSNYGCATAVNLAAMIADPRDLVRGKTDPMTGADPALAQRAIKAWRETGTTGKQGIEKTGSKAN